MHDRMEERCDRGPEISSFQNIPKGLRFRGELVALCEHWPDKLDDLPKYMKKISNRYRKSKDADTILKPLKLLKRAWWYLMIRAIAWRMSVEIQIPESPKLVPSGLYGNQSRVWIA